jgi:plastocyanin
MASMRTRGLVLVAATLALVATACGGGDGGGDAYVEPKGKPVATIKLESGNTFFDPDKVDAPAGIIAIDLKNIESGIHDLVIRDVPGFQIEVSGEGDEVTKKVDLKPGKYEFYCTIPGHEEAGMKGTLTVS